MLKSKGGRIRHKITLRDNFHGISKTQTGKAIGYTFNNDTWFDFCEYLNDSVRIELGDILVECIKNNKSDLLDQYILDHDINDIGGLLCSKVGAHRIIIEIVQDNLNNIRISSTIRGAFRIILDYLIIKFAKEYITEMKLI